MHVTQKQINSGDPGSSEERVIDWDWKSSAECHQYIFPQSITPTTFMS